MSLSIKGEATSAALQSDPGTLPDAFWRWAVRYVLQHADTVNDGISLPAHAGHPPALSAHDRRKASISVVIPLFNQGHYLREAVTSAINQGVPDLEIVVVNDGSTDRETNQIFDDLRGITKIKQDNKGRQRCTEYRHTALQRRIRRAARRG